MTLEEAATVFVGTVCPLYFLRRARIQPCERVLVHGASGSLETFAVQADLEFLKTLVKRGKLRAVIGRTFSIDQIVEAHRHADAGHKIGNLVVVIGGARQRS